MKMTTEYTSCSCNRTPGALSWLYDGKICYASCNTIVVLNPEPPVRVISTVVGHKDRVNSVKWISKGQVDKNEIISVSVDKTARIFTEVLPNKYVQSAVLSGHQASVTSVDTVGLPDGSTFIVTASADSTVKLWKRTQDGAAVSEVQTISFGTGFTLDVALTFAPKSDALLLACGCDDHRVHIFVQQELDQFVSVATLAGHEDWVRGLDITTDDSGDVLVASASQDSYIRVWRLSQEAEPCSGEEMQRPDLEQEIKLKKNIYSYKWKDKAWCFTATVETVLQGHDGWVYSVQWRSRQAGDPLCLLSASMDKSLVIWQPEEASGIWIEKARLGDVGGTSLGYYGAVFSPDGSSIVSHGYQGGVRRWTLDSKGSWVPGVICGGHYASVHDICWQPITGHFLLSVGQDQTTRCHGYWNTGDIATSSWHEIARPQVHGYDMQCIAMLDRFTFASGADEKVIRVFQAPRNFVNNLQSLSRVETTKAEQESLPEGASVPALGLSNKAVFMEDMEKPRDHIDEQYPEHAYQAVGGDHPPTEGDLMQNTLWPEVHKLYGHGYEIFALAAHPGGHILASACKAAQPSQAAVILWGRTSWERLASLESHSLTVTQLSFSPSGRYLLSVSRDRTWAVYQQSDNIDSPSYVRVAYSDKKTAVHSRIIWSCSWSHDENYFVTVSRDKKAVFWSRPSTPAETSSCLAGWTPTGTSLDLPDSITAVDVAPVLLSGQRYLVALGLDNGCIQLYSWNISSGWSKVKAMTQSEAHHKTVKRLRFRPVTGSLHHPGDTSLLYLASAGADHCVRIYSIDLNQITADAQDCKNSVH